MPERSETAIDSRRILICAPHGRDGILIATILREHGLPSEPYATLDQLSAQVDAGVAVAILTEEALFGSSDSLQTVLRRQPSWSDLPIIVLTTGGEPGGDRTWQLMGSLDAIRNVSLLERPLRAMTLVSAVQVALRSRERQYQVKYFQEDLEHRVAERTAELQRLNEEAEGFSYTIAHDLRTPLRAIISSSRILLEDYAENLPEEAAQELERQAQAAGRLARLIDDLLKLSKLSREEMMPREFDFSAMAQEVAATVLADFGDRPCEFKIQPGLMARGDPVLLRLAMQNLLQNACKFSPQGGVVRVGKCDDSYYVADQGIGFPAEYADRIFMPFERLVNQLAYPGTGIGLANVKRIIERHGGSVWAESEPGVGSKFRFTLG